MLQISQLSQKVFEINKNIIQLEKDLENNEEESAKEALEILESTEKQPEKIIDASFRKQLFSLISKSKKAAVAVTKAAKITYRSVKVTGKTAVWAFFLWFMIEYLPRFLEPTRYHQDIEQIEIMLQNGQVIQEWIDSLPKDKLKQFSISALDENKLIVEEQLNIVLMEKSEELYNHIIFEVSQKYPTIAKNVKDAVKDRSNVDISKIPEGITVEDVEKLLLQTSKDDRATLIKSIHTTLRQYYTVDLLKSELPNFLDLGRAIISGNPDSIYYNLAWGGGEAKITVKAEDMIRKELNTLLEPTINGIKKEIEDAFSIKKVWKEVKTVIITSITNPSQAAEALEKLGNKLAVIGGVFVVPLIIFALLGGGLILSTGFKWFVINYYKDIKKLIKLIKPKR